MVEDTSYVLSLCSHLALESVAKSVLTYWIKKICLVCKWTCMPVPPANTKCILVFNNKEVLLAEINKLEAGNYMKSHRFSSFLFYHYAITFSVSLFHTGYVQYYPGYIRYKERSDTNTKRIWNSKEAECSSMCPNKLLAKPMTLVQYADPESMAVCSSAHTINTTFQPTWNWCQSQFRACSYFIGLEKHF